MKNSTKRILTLIILIATLATLSMLTVSASEVCEGQTQTAADEIQIEAKYKKTSTNKITWNGNGGKIGSKKTVVSNIKKGAKIKKLPTTPKRSGYSFKGWYTKKTGGKKITVSTKPKSTVTYFAQWEKAKVLNAEEKKLVGKWVYEWDKSMIFQFNSNGTYSKLSASDYYDVMFIGSYSLKNGVLTKQYQCRYDYGSGWGSWSAWETSTNKITFGTKTDGTPYFTEYGLRYLKV